MCIYVYSLQYHRFIHIETLFVFQRKMVHDCSNNWVWSFAQFNKNGFDSRSRTLSPMMFILLLVVACLSSNLYVALHFGSKVDDTELISHILVNRLVTTVPAATAITYNPLLKVTAVPTCFIFIRGVCRIKTGFSHVGLIDITSLENLTDTNRSYCIKRSKDWARDCDSTTYIFDPLYQKAESVVRPTCRFRINNNHTCIRNNDLNSSLGWFSEDPTLPSTTWSNCYLRRMLIQKVCGSKVDVQMKFDGPGNPVSLFSEEEDKDPNQWSITDTDGFILSIKKLQHQQQASYNSNHQSCYHVSRYPESPGKIVSRFHFCYPSIVIAGHMKTGTSFLYHALTKHPSFRKANEYKEFCPKQNGYQRSYFNYFLGLSRPPPSSTGNKNSTTMTVNACLSPDEILDLHMILHHPKVLYLYLVRDLAAQVWSMYNFWCHPQNEHVCNIGDWVIPGVHKRSPELFHQEILFASSLSMSSSRQQQSSSTTNTTTTSLYELSSGAFRNYYLRYIHLLESVIEPNTVLVLSSEQMKQNLTLFWEVIANKFNERMFSTTSDSRTVPLLFLPEHPSLLDLAKTRINANNQKGLETKDASTHTKKVILDCINQVNIDHYKMRHAISFILCGRNVMKLVNVHHGITNVVHKNKIEIKEKKRTNTKRR